MQFEETKVDWSGTVQIDKNKNFQYKECQGFLYHTPVVQLRQVL